MTNFPAQDHPQACIDPPRRKAPFAMSFGASDGAADRPRVQRQARAAAPVAIALLGPVLVVAISALRSPEIMLRGRFWSEDSYFLAHMLASEFSWHQIFYIYRGHLEILNSTVFAIAADLNLKMIPLVTTYFGLSVECVLAFLLIFFREDLEMRLLSALLICALIVVSPCSFEHYLNMLNSVWLCSAILLLIINLPPLRLEGRELIIVPSTLILGLSGMPATCLAPVAFMYAWVWRSRPHLLMAATLALCCLIQGVLLSRHGSPDRFSPVSAWVYLAGPFLHIVIEHLMGVDAASALGQWFRGTVANSASIPSLMFGPLALLAWMIVHVARKGAARSKLLLVSFIYITVFNVTFAIGDRNDLFTVYAMRYFFVPSFILALLLARTETVSLNWSPHLMLAVLIVVTVVSGRDFFQNPFGNMYVEQRYDWRRDVERCRASADSCSIEIEPGRVFVNVPARALR